MIAVAFYGLACTLALWFAARAAARDRQDAKTCAAILTLCWAIYGTTYLADHKMAWPVMDWLACTAIARNYRADPRAFKLWIIVFFCCQMAAHIQFWTFVALGDNTKELRYAYRTALNALFIGQLLAVSGPGVRRAWSDISIHLRSPGRNLRLHLRRDAGPVTGDPVRAGPFGMGEAS